VSFQKCVDFVGKNYLFCNNNPRQIEDKIIEFILLMRDEGKSKAFYKINDIVLNVYKISKFMPEHIKVNRDRATLTKKLARC
jgi:hypothetical protein